MKKIVIVGASSGIGRALAQMYLKDGCYVGVIARRDELLQEIINDYPNSAFARKFDITETDKCDNVMNSLVSELGGVDVVIISSGTGELNTKLDFNIEHATISVNVYGFTAVADWAYNKLKKQGGGHIVAITSLAGVRGGAFAPSYNASKAYQISYIQALKQKAAKDKCNVKISDIRPGFVDTDMAKGDGLFWVAPLEKAAKQIKKAIDSSKKIVYVTRRWRAVAWLIKILPDSLYNKIG